VVYFNLTFKIILSAINNQIYKLIAAISLVKQISRTQHRRVIILNHGPAKSFSNQLHRQFSNHLPYQLVKGVNLSKTKIQILLHPTFFRSYLLSLHNTHPNLFSKFNKTLRQLNTHQYTLSKFPGRFSNKVKFIALSNRLV
jgi:hypothetical protein